MKFMSLVSAISLMIALVAGSAVQAAEPAKQQQPVGPLQAGKPLPDPVARVNGTPIPASELRHAFKALQGTQGPVPADKILDAQKFVLNQLVIGELMYQMSKNTPVADMDKRMNDAVGRLKGRFKSEEEYRKGLKDQGISEKELRDLIRRNIVIENYIEKMVASKVTVSEADTKAYYDKNPETFTLPEQVRASHILITVDAKASDAEKKQARAKIEDLLKQIKGGADFAKLAEQHSGCPSSKQGGDLGYFSKGQMVKPFEDTAWGMKIGEISGVVETNFGYHLIKVTGRQASAKIPYESIKARIEGNLKQQKISEGVNALLEQARKTAKIEVYLN